MSDPTIVDRLVTHRTLGAAPRSELEWLAAHGSLRQLAEGDLFLEKGGRVNGLFVILSGHIALFLDRGGGLHKAIEWRAGDVTGVLPYSRVGNSPGESVALEPTEFLDVPRAEIGVMTRECPEVTSILVHTMLDRSRLFTSNALQDEKMISLGKLSAGLAHELNNPASAIERSAALLDDRLRDGVRATRALCRFGLTEVQLEALDALRLSCEPPAARGVLSPIARAEREEAIADWLADHQIDDSVGGPLAETAVTIEALDRLAAALDGPALAAALGWAAAECSVREIASEIQEASMRISGLVTAVRGFTHMDQAMVAEPVDLASGLRNTVTILAAKARKKAVAVNIAVESGLPLVQGFVGELNQIWSNLIDNALDAVADSGRVDVTATRMRDQVVVRIVDNGAGIAPEVRDRIFDPFFTTKPVGHGTGLGLDIVRRLVSHNDATIEVESVPGRTEFRVSLPVAGTARAKA